jgi:uncharacterized protein YrrD
MNNLRVLLEMRGHRLRAIDKDIGSVEDFYFDDRLWKVRYLVVDTGNWLPGRKVLIGPEVVEGGSREDHVLPVSLTSTAIEDSPGIESDLPFSLQKERELRTFFQWREYWDDEIFIQSPGYTQLGVPGAEAVELSPHHQVKAPSTLHENQHLRSANEIQGYFIHATNGDLGHVDDFLVTGSSWEIRYLVVDTRNWIPGKKVLVSPKWVSSVDWRNNLITIKLTREKIQGSPEYFSHTAFSKEDELNLSDYYDSPYNWDP